MPVTNRKAFAYITWNDSLLVFSHPRSPEAGLQVPAGTVRDDETPEQAVMREATEETGLGDLEIVDFLGEHVKHRSDVGHPVVVAAYDPAQPDLLVPPAAVG